MELGNGVERLTCQTRGKVLISLMIRTKIISFHARDMCRISSRNIVKSEVKSWYPMTKVSRSRSGSSMLSFEVNRQVWLLWQ